MEAKDDLMVLNCGVCGHDHEQNVKCMICGHIGKSRSYQCLKKTYTAFEFTVQGFDCLGQDETIAGTVAALKQSNLSLWTFVRILRGRIFPNMATMLPDDPMSRHLVAFVGDGPMGITRWRPAAEESGSQVVIIEFFGIVENKRRQGYAKRFLLAVIQDITAIYAQQSRRPQELIATMPQTDSFAAIRLFQSIGFQPVSRVEVVQDRSFLQMRMAWS
ncbi:unnamed protein product [Peronospora belbahrii]|uniref:N-acetyltransferase domain-containing protein n=1 Tax=Peronospora belbahrii TaxID=622444 RepID=A0AAU9L856_9STRA|nr:unnamed protein product [Peronospora belbahrii]CAH0517256.1 unnamed protein product [Peronospora belbahrii]